MNAPEFIFKMTEKERHSESNEVKIFGKKTDRLCLFSLQAGSHGFHNNNHFIEVSPST